MTEVSETPAQNEQEAPKRGRPSSRPAGEYVTTTIRYPRVLAADLNRFKLVNGTTTEGEIVMALEAHIVNTKASAEYKQKLNALLSQ